jgi:hypothetical protein
MASSIVHTIRSSSSSSSSSDATVIAGGGGGRFLKEDQDSGYWVEIGDEKAIRKAAQALREMAPVLRHHHTSPPPPPPSSDGKKGKGGGRGKADPPGPRHRPGPPQREGLINNNSNSNNERRNKNRSPAAAVTATSSSTSAVVGLPDDKILDRMRNEYRKMELLQAEHTRKMQLLQDMELYENQRSRGGQQSEGRSSSNNRPAHQTMTNDSNHSSSLHSSIEELGWTAREALAALPLPPSSAKTQHSVQSSGSGSSQGSHQEWDIQAEYLKMQALLMQRNQLAEKLSAQHLLDASSSSSSSNERRGMAALQQKDQQQQPHYYMQNTSSSMRNSNTFNRQYSSNLGGDDHTMYTLSSTDSTTKSIDMSSLGGFTWNMWNNASAVSDVNSNNNSCGNERNIAMMASSRTSCNSTLSLLEQKLENARQAQRCLEHKLEMQRMQQQCQQQQQQQQQQRQQQKNLTASMNSLGIDDDESFRVSNMEFSEMDMSCFSNTTTTTDHPSNSYSNMLEEYVRGNKGDTTTSKRTAGTNPTNTTYTKAQQQQQQQQQGSSMVDDDLLNASLKSLEISDNNFVGNITRQDNMGDNKNLGHQIHQQQQQQQQQHVQHSSSSVHDMGISDVDFGISISSLKSIDVEYDDDWLLSQQTKGMESINELVNPWDTDDDNDAAAAAAAAAGNRSVRMMYASEAA